MARTRGASGAFHQDDGELLDKEGKPIPTTSLTPKLIHMDDGEIVPPAPKPVLAPVSVNAATAYLCDRTTWQKTMEAVEALELIGILVGGPLSATLTPGAMGLCYRRTSGGISGRCDDLSAKLQNLCLSPEPSAQQGPLYLDLRQSQ
jgi:hypothetical protein